MPNFNQWDRVPRSRQTVPEGVYVLMAEAMDDKLSSTGKKMYELTMRIEAPDEYAGASLPEENFVVGTDDDPGADDPETWLDPRNVAVKRLRDLFEALKLDMSKGVDALVKSVPGKRFQATVFLNVEPDKNRDGSVNRFAGNQKNKLGRMYGMGEVVPAPRGAATVVAMGPGRARAAAAPARAAVASPPPPPVAAPAAPRVAAPKAAAAKKERTLECDVCNAVVAVSQWAAHAESHGGVDDQE